MCEFENNDVIKYTFFFTCLRIPIAENSSNITGKHADSSLGSLGGKEGGSLGGSLGSLGNPAM